MPFKSTLTGGALATLLAIASSLPAQADVFHAVEPGETLSSVAARYRLTPEAIRTANRLDTTRDNATLPTMLLLIPDASNVTTAKPVNKALPSALPSAQPSQGQILITTLADATTLNAPSGKTHAEEKPSARPNSSGIIMQMTTYVVKQGETLESIARKFSRPGQPVTVGEIRRRNYLAGEPAPGTMLLVPVANASFGSTGPASSANATPSISPDSPDNEALQEAPRAGEDNIATVLPQSNPIYQAPNEVFAAVSASSAPRRGTVLASRGLPAGDDSVRVVQPGQETPTVGSAPSPRSRVIPTSSPQRLSLAQVARVARSGGTIRRLPDSEAVGLYRCPVGTELAVIKQSGLWSAILMIDHSTGWIPNKYLKMTGVHVDISTQVVTQDSYQGTTTGNFRSNHPAVAQALTWLGTPYVYGGSSRRGIDCSALVMKSFASCGVQLPRTAAQQARVGLRISPAQLQVGDRLYFSAGGTRVDHTGLYLGDGYFVHASGRGRQVMVSRLFDPAHWNIFVWAQR